MMQKLTRNVCHFSYTLDRKPDWHIVMSSDVALYLYAYAYLNVTQFLSRPANVTMRFIF